MPEATITLEGHDEELAVFGSRDHHLRQVRDSLRVKVLARHGAIKVEGEPERVEQARRVFATGKPVFIDKPVAGTLRDVLEQSAALGIQVDFTGSGLAAAQQPAPGTPLRQGERIRVQFAR